MYSVILTNIGAVLAWKSSVHQCVLEFCPGFWCRVFSAGMQIVVDKNLENTIWQCFWRLFNKALWTIYAYLRHLESYYCILRWIKQGFWNWLSGRPGHTPHSCQTSVVHRATRYFRTWNHKIHSKWFAVAVPSNICWWWATSIFGGQVKFEILVAQGQPHHFWISETLTKLK
jgi:hypothetical protein